MTGVKTFLAATVIAAGLVGMTTVVHAQDTAPALDAVGRYTALTTNIDGKPGTVLIDTAYGRAWMLGTDANGKTAWIRVFFDNKSEEVPEGAARRPSRIRN